MKNVATRTISIGEKLRQLARNEDELLRDELLEELDDIVTGMLEEQLIRMCISAAVRGELSVNIGKCVPPNLVDYGITFRSAGCGCVSANW